MKALALAIRALPVAIVLSTGACGAYSRAYYASHPDQARRAQAKAQDQRAEAAKASAPVVQAGSPAPKAAPTRVTERRGPLPTPSHNEVPDEPTAAAASATVPVAAPASRTARRDRAAKSEAARARTGSATAAAPAAAPADQTSTTSTAAAQKRLDAMLGKQDDGQTAGMFMISNDIDLSFARLAYHRSKNEEVKAFAKRMLTDHAQIIASVQTMLDDLDVTPVDNPLSRDLRDWSSFKRDSLLGLDDRAFDLSYAQSEVIYHKQFLSLIDDVLLPRATDAAVREQITTMRPVIAAHLAHAERLAAALAH